MTKIQPRVTVTLSSAEVPRARPSVTAHLPRGKRYAEWSTLNARPNPAALTVLLRRARKNRFERRYDCGVELSINCLGNPETRHARGHCLAVRAVRCHRIVGVRHGKNPGNKRDVV